MKKVQHMVLLKFKAGTPEKSIADCFTALERLRNIIPGIVHYSGGPYASPEGMNAGYTHGFLMTFRDVAARDRYLPHPEHEAVKQMVIPLIDGALAFDYEE